MEKRKNTTKLDRSSLPTLRCEVALTFDRIAEEWSQQQGIASAKEIRKWLLNAFLKGEFDNEIEGQIKSFAVLLPHLKRTLRVEGQSESTEPAGEYIPINRDGFVNLTGDVVYSSANYEMHEGAAKTYFRILGSTKLGIWRFCKKHSISPPEFWFSQDEIDDASREEAACHSDTENLPATRPTDNRSV